MKNLLLPVLILVANNLLAQAVTESPSGPGELSNNSLFVILSLLAFVLLIVVFVMAGAVKNLAENRKLWQNRWAKTGIPVFLAMMFVSTGAIAQSTEGYGQMFQVADSTIMVLWGLIAILSLVVLFLAAILKKMLNILNPKAVEEQMEAASLVNVLQNKLAGSHPIELEEEILLDHEYDGIRELDNDLPPWWKYGFYVTIVFAVIYMIRFHVTGTGDLQDAEYQKELVAAEIEKEAYIKLTGNKVDEHSVTFLPDAESISAGKAIYSQSCAACHGASLEGGVGPNLTDEYWIHGGDVKDVFKLIKYGNPQKGMIAWQGQLGPKQIQEVSSYILSMQGTNPPNAKEPQGEKHIPTTVETIQVDL